SEGPKEIGNQRQLSIDRVLASAISGPLLFQRLSGNAKELGRVSRSSPQPGRRPPFVDGGNWPGQPSQWRGQAGSNSGLASAHGNGIRRGRGLYLRLDG